MLFLLILVSALASQAASAATIDVSALKIGQPATVVELDLGKLKGDLQQICWSPDGKQIYVQTADGDSVLSKPHHYVVTLAGASVNGLDAAPPWAAEYWNIKSYKSAPGVDALEIAVKAGREKTLTTVPKDGEYAGDAGRGGGVNLGLNTSNPGNIRSGVVRLELLDESVGTFVDTKPVPGLTFGWGPDRSGAIAFVDRDGHLLLMDQRKHKTSVAGTKDVTLPAWSSDGSALAWAQKTARKKYALMVAPVTR